MTQSRYEAYRKSDIDWLGEIPSHWKSIALKHLVSTPVTDGPHETPELVSDGIPFISAEAISDGWINFEKKRGFISAENNIIFSRKYKPQRHDIYLIKSGATTGTSAIVDTTTEFNIWSPLAAIRCGKKIDPYFLLAFIRSINYQRAIELNWSYGTQQNIGMKVIENLPIPIPTRREQISIVNFLDRETAKIDSLITEQERLIELLQEKRQAVISHAVTKGLNPNAPMKDSGVEWLGEVPEHWKISAVSYRYSVQLGKMLDSSQQTGNHKKPYLRVADVQWGSINIDELPEMDFPPEIQAKYSLKAGDLLVNEGGSYVGRSAIWSEPIEECYYQKALHRLRPYNSSEDSSSFMYWLMEYATHLGVFVAGGNQTTIDHLTAEQLRRYRFGFPSLKEQVEIADYLLLKTEQFQSLITKAEKLVDILQERRSALISAAVTGQIDVRGLVPKEEAA